MLSTDELREYRSLVGQINWTSQHSRPDMAYHVSEYSRFFKSATTQDMRNLIKTLKRLKIYDVKIKISKLVGKISIEIYSDASFANINNESS